MEGKYFNIEGPSWLTKAGILCASLVCVSTLQAAPFIYVANLDSNNVTVIDVATNTVTATIDAGVGPAHVRMSVDGARAWVFSVGSVNYDVIDTSTRNLIGNYTSIYDDLLLGTLSPDRATLYQVNYATNTVSVINTSDGSEIATVAVGVGPEEALVTPDGKWTYVTNYESDSVSIIDTTSNIVVATVGVGAAPYGMASSPDSSRIYVVNSGSNTLSVIDTGIRSVIAEVLVGNLPLHAVVTPDGTRVYVSNVNDNNVSVISTSTNTLLTSVAAGLAPWDLAATPEAFLMTGLFWNHNESGWGVNLVQQYGVVFATFFAYDASGLPTWYVASNCAVVGNGCSGELYAVVAGSELVAPWNGANLVETAVGNVVFSFSDKDHGTMSFTIDGVSGSKVIERQIWRTQ